MFKGNNEEFKVGAGEAEDTIIGSTIKIEGDLVSNGNIIIEGEVSGSLKTDKQLQVGTNAKVTADVKAEDAHIAGEVNGNIEVLGKIELTETARVNGDIKAKVISIQAGASFNGRSTMTEGVRLNAPVVKTEVVEEK